jgi:hypothetical protein
MGSAPGERGQHETAPAPHQKWSVSSGHLFATHPSGGLLWSGGPTGPEGSVYVIPTMAFIALGVWIAWSETVRGKEPESAVVLPY